MSVFPALKTGAVLQYPAVKVTQFATQVVRFVDGSEQRFRLYASALRRWMIRLDLLDEAELHALREFFRTEGGTSGSFAFVDPFDGTEYTSCSFEVDSMQERLTPNGGTTSVTVVQNRS